MPRRAAHVTAGVVMPNAHGQRNQARVPTNLGEFSNLNTAPLDSFEKCTGQTWPAPPGGESEKTPGGSACLGAIVRATSLDTLAANALLSLLLWPVSLWLCALSFPAARRLYLFISLRLDKLGALPEDGGFPVAGATYAMSGSEHLIIMVAQPSG